jgi:hypothetical protein
VLVKLASRSADHVVQRIQRQLQHLPAELCTSVDTSNPATDRHRKSGHHG